MNPQTQLFEILAESSIRARSIAQIHDRSMQTLNDRYNVLSAQIRQLRPQLKANPTLKPKYLRAIANLRKLAQSYAMGRQRPQQPQNKADPPGLQKALDYGELLLEVYGDRSLLVKGARSDLIACATSLMQYDNLKAQELAQKLIQLGR